MFRHIFHPADPAGTFDETGVMMGLGIQFTPDTTGAVLISVDGLIYAPTPTSGRNGGYPGGTDVALFGAEGTASPANGAPVSGVQLSTQLNVPGPGGWFPFSLHTYVKVAAGVPAWIDLALVSGGDPGSLPLQPSQVRNLGIVVVEI
jgi:hypothetical protein